MTSNQEPIIISSDSESQESREPSPFPPYLPPYRPPRFGSRTKEQARKFKHDINAPILVSLATIQPIPKTRANRRSNQPQAPRTAPKPSRTTPKPPKTTPKSQRAQPSRSPSSSTSPSESPRVVIGLVCSKVWEIASQSMGKNRTMPDEQSLKDALSMD